MENCREKEASILSKPAKATLPKRFTKFCMTGMGYERQT